MAIIIQKMNLKNENYYKKYFTSEIRFFININYKKIITRQINRYDLQYYSPAGLIHVYHLSKFLKRSINIWLNESIIYSFNSSFKKSAIDVGFLKGNNQSIGHFTLKGRKEPIEQFSKYRHSCLFDVVASQTGYEPDELRREVIRRIRLNLVKEHLKNYNEILLFSETVSTGSSVRYNSKTIKEAEKIIAALRNSRSYLQCEDIRGGARYVGESEKDAQKLLDASQKGRRYSDSRPGHPRGHAYHQKATGHYDSVHNYARFSNKPKTGFLSRADQDLLAHRFLLTRECSDAMELLNFKQKKDRFEAVTISSGKFDEEDLRKVQEWSANGEVLNKNPRNIEKLTMVLGHFYDKYDDEDADVFIVTFYPQIQ